MKKFILTSFALLGFATVNAQNNQVTLNVKLKPIQTLLVNPAQKEVDLLYTTAADYSGGVSSTQADHLTVYSTGGFEVKVKSGDANIVNGSKNIAANTITITASNGSNNSITGATYTPISLSNNDQVIATSATGGVNKNINVTYAGAGADTYVNNYIAGQTPTTYTTTLTYTILAK
ncbi:hypothetical protein MKS83_08830 [Chryseobacterium sp. Y16C]|uniref:hypothetical protein n=1 Tax=Chryseobacterium sp. Y16C TaxID=2920939 RepID=UPI001F0C0372|nr:hypothetical protein [Chryseobacterium sp. Y16C]UMQ43795.1 hypothetical protein MKS83_08830 [Chryseobacterium sp. Y16C]